MPFLVVDPVSDDEAVGYGEPQVVDGDGHLPPGRLVEEGADPDLAGTSPFDHSPEEVEGETRVDDVVDEDDGPAGHRDVHVHQQNDLSRRFRSLAVAGGPHEVDLRGDRHGANEVGEKDERSLEDADQNRPRVAEVGVETGGDPPDRRADFLGAWRGESRSTVPILSGRAGEGGRGRLRA